MVYLFLQNLIIFFYLKLYFGLDLILILVGFFQYLFFVTLNKIQDIINGVPKKQFTLMKITVIQTYNNMGLHCTRIIANIT